MQFPILVAFQRELSFLPNLNLTRFRRLTRSVRLPFLRVADLVSLVRFAKHEQNDLHPFRDDVHKNFAEWMASNTGPRAFGRPRMLPRPGD